MILTVIIILGICTILCYACCVTGGKADRECESQYYEHMKSKNNENDKGE